MSSTSNGSNARSATTFVDDSIGGTSVFVDTARRHVVADSEGVLAGVAAAMARVEQEIDYLWHNSMRASDRVMSQRLADVGHALQRAVRLLEHDDTIG
jgi:hypothetical protein